MPEYEKILKRGRGSDENIKAANDEFNKIRQKMANLQGTKYEKIVYSNDWSFVGGAYLLTIPSTEHNFSKITSVNVEMVDSDRTYFENVVFSYKSYTSGAVAITLGKQINCKITIEGES